MATDGLTLRACIEELRPLVGGRIDKVQQPDKDIVILHLHGPNVGRVRLMLCIHAENGRIQTVSRAFENPDAAPAFCMLLRKHLVGCRIVSVEQAGLNRIAVFTLSGRNELYDAVQLRLVVELMGRHGNLFLLDEAGRIIDCMRHFGISESAARICLPNVVYEAPPEVEKRDPFAVTEAEFAALANGRMPAAWLLNACAGVSKLCAEQIVADGTPPERIGAAVYAVFSALKAGNYSPCMIPDMGVLPFRSANAGSIPFPTVNEAQDAFYRRRDEQAILTKQRTSLRAVLDRAKKRAEKKVGEYTRTIGSEDSIERDRLYGELLLSCRPAYGGQKEITVPNYYADPPASVAIPLDPKFSVAENAQRYFRRYRKNKAARAYALNEIEAMNEELDYLKGQLLNVAACSTREELSEIRDELVRLRYIRESDAPHKTQPGAKSEPLRYRTPSGVEILVGKNNLQNERLIRSADPNAIWLHAKGVPASHVILNTSDPSREELYLAACIGAYHSTAANSGNVPVDYTQVRHVKKPSGARPGFVNYFHQHTLYVTPSFDEIAPYRVTEDK